MDEGDSHIHTLSENVLNRQVIFYDGEKTKIMYDKLKKHLNKVYFLKIRW